MNISRKTAPWMVVFYLFFFSRPLIQLVTAEVILVENGRPKATLILANNPSEAARRGAEDLNKHLEKATGVSLPIRREGDIPGGSLNASENWVLVGESRFIRTMGVVQNTLPEEGFVISARKNILAIVGKDTKRPKTYGTFFGVAAFLERELGVRWLWPGDLGTVVPHTTTISIKEGEFRDQPALVKRKIRTGYLRNKQLSSALQEFALTGKLDAMEQEEEIWTLRHRLGEHKDVNAGHAFTDWWEKYGTSHPEWFALQTGGSRGGLKVPPDRKKLCQSNQQVVDEFVLQARQTFDRDPTRWSVRAAPNDSAYLGFCMCPACKALDPENAPPVLLQDGDTKKKFSYPALTDRHVVWWNRMAQEIEKTHPGRALGVLAYGAFRTPPVKEKLNPNIFVGFVGLDHVLYGPAQENDRNLWREWSASAPRLFLRPNLLHSGLAFPLNYARTLAQDLKTCFKTKMFAADFDSLENHWGTQGLIYYVLAKTLWNPEVDVNAVIEDYVQAGFGNAAPAVKAYFDQLEIMTTEISQTQGSRSPQMKFSERQPHDAQVVATVFLKYLEQLRTKLEEARHLAQSASVEIQQRIKFLAGGLEYGKRQALVVKALQDKKDVEKAVKERDDFYFQHASDWVIYPPAIRMLEKRAGMKKAVKQNPNNVLDED